jgi:hypothetical protein
LNIQSYPDELRCITRQFSKYAYYRQTTYYNIMGAVFRSKDIGMGYKKIIENAIKDLSPDTKDNVIKLFNSWEGIPSIQKLKEIMGPDKAERLLKQIRANKKIYLTDEERDALKDILKESLTFD